MLNCAQAEQNQVSSCRHEHSKAKAWNDCAGFFIYRKEDAIRKKFATLKENESVILVWIEQ
jgi:hypothetical protein